MRTLLSSFAALCVLGGCASAPRGPAPLDPVGAFDFSTTVEGTDVSGTITVTREANGYGGTITTDVTEPIPIRTVSVQGQTMEVAAETPDGPLTMTLTFTGDAFTGSWSMADGSMSGALTGSRRTGGS